jgi:predicted metal-dependent hydrolase
LNAPAPLSEEDERGLRLGLTQFNEGCFFECHDTLEEVWSGMRGERRDFFQGLIQVSVGLYHWSNANPGGALTLLERGLKRLSGYGARYEGVDLEALRSEVASARSAIEAGQPFPEALDALPKVRRGGAGS